MPDSASEWIPLAALNHSLPLSACVWPGRTVKWDRLVPSFNSCQHLLIMARTALIKRGTHLPWSLALHRLTRPHDSGGREGRGEQKRGHLAAAELIGRVSEESLESGDIRFDSERYFFRASRCNGNMCTELKSSSALKPEQRMQEGEHYSRDAFTEEKGFLDMIHIKLKLSPCGIVRGCVCKVQVVAIRWFPPQCLLGRLGLCWESGVIRLVGCQCQEIERQS